VTPSSVLDILKRMTELVDRAKTAHRNGLRAQQRADEYFAERDRAIREALNQPGTRPSQRAIARELGLSPERVSQIARGTRGGSA
jgi:hypothetical protein